jgi:hypothetical protein
MTKLNIGIIGPRKTVYYLPDYQIVINCAVQVREVGIYKANKYKSNETPLSFPAGNQSCPARVSHPPEASLA